MEKSKKLCGNCKDEKAREEFRLVPDKRSGNSYPCSWCRECERKKALEKYRATREISIERNKTYKQANSEVLKDKRKVYLEENKEYVKERYRKYCENNKEKINEIARNYRRNNPHVQVKQKIASRLRELIKKEKRTEDYLGAPVSLVMEWLEFNFDDNMSWDNQGAYWHIDHCLPTKLFNMDHEEEQYICFCWMNLSPLERCENISKGCKLVDNLLCKQKLRLLQFAKVKGIEDEVDKFLEAYQDKIVKLVEVQHNQNVRETP